LNPIFPHGLDKVGIADCIAIRRLAEVLEHTDYDYQNNKPNQEVLSDIVQREVLIKT
jgi:hypothetical protein